MKPLEAEERTVAEAWLRLLKSRGVDHLFVNAGTDFPSIVEAFAKAGPAGEDMPVPVIVPHENAATAMAHGYYLATGRVQAVMVHVNVGTANAASALMNASREQVPILFAAGRTPILEQGRPGARSSPIHWAQEMFDQAGLVRETTRWDYELRAPEQLETVVDRVLAIATSHPRGPVYLSLPREVLAEPAAAGTGDLPSRIAASRGPAPAAEAIEAAADILASAQNPLIITSRLGADQGALDALGSFAERHAIPVVDYRPRYLNFPSDHSMHAGFEVDPWLETADAILVLDSDVPWVPASRAPRADCRIIQVAVDPLFTRYPIRGFASDLTIVSEPRSAVAALAAALADRECADVTARRRRVQTMKATLASGVEGRIAAARSSSPMGRAWISRCIGEALGEEGIVVNEYPFAREAAVMNRPGSYFGSSSVSGLGWGLPAALGVKLAAPERTVVATLGDGAYIFANPVACHQMAESCGLSVLTIVFNNGEWGAVRKATEGMYPGGHAARSNDMPLVSLGRFAEYEKLVSMFGGYGRRVDRAEDLPSALAEALDVVRLEKRQALLNVRCS